MKTIDNDMVIVNGIDKPLKWKGKKLKGKIPTPKFITKYKKRLKGYNSLWEERLNGNRV